jgi:hypothetical protein
VKVRCYLRHHRGRCSLRDLTTIAGVKGLNPGALSLIEQGRLIPRDSWIPSMEAVYGVPRTRWWPREVLTVLELDDRETRIADGIED